MSEISEAALRRREAFLKAKEEAGGAAELIESNKNRPWTVYFTEDGEITCFSNGENVTVNPDWLTYDFTREQVSILIDKDLKRYRIKRDDKDSEVFHIQLKPLENVFVSASRDFLYQIETSKKKKWDIKCELQKDHLLVTMHENTKKEYENVYPISATKNGQRLLKFSITAPNDPHFVYHYEVVALADLLVNKTVKLKMTDDLRDHSIYTNKLFDTYIRK